jgi:hypothetical protein
MYRKEWDRNDEGGLDKIMLEFTQALNVRNAKSTIDQETGEILNHAE